MIRKASGAGGCTHTDVVQLTMRKRVALDIWARRHFQAAVAGC